MAHKGNMPRQTMTHDIITAAIDGFEAQKKRIDAQIADLRQALTGNGTHALATSEPVRGRRKMSAAARKRIADAQRKRWAAMRRQSGHPTTAEGAKPKRRISAAGRVAIIEASRKRWTAYRAQKARAKKASANR
jgi:hypothetical protein